MYLSVSCNFNQFWQSYNIIDRDWLVRNRLNTPYRSIFRPYANTTETVGTRLETESQVSRIFNRAERSIHLSRDALISQRNDATRRTILRETSSSSSPPTESTPLFLPFHPLCTVFSRHRELIHRSSNVCFRLAAWSRPSCVFVERVDVQGQPARNFPAILISSTCLLLLLPVYPELKCFVSLSAVRLAGRRDNSFAHSSGQSSSYERSRSTPNPRNYLCNLRVHRQPSLYSNPGLRAAG